MKIKKSFCIGVFSLIAFVLWTVLVSFVDVRAIGPQGSTVGFSKINQFFHSLTGVNMALYHITDWLSIVPLIFVPGFAILGLKQWIERKELLKVDYSILVLGGFYITVFLLYAFFEIAVVNYRPVLIDGVLEASYPSSTTVLAACVMPTALMQLNARIKSARTRRVLNIVVCAFIAFMLTARFISGVHWFTDIVGGIFLSLGLVMLYYCIYKST
jgi:undecaprenyl-diphosphatase